MLQDVVKICCFSWWELDTSNTSNFSQRRREKAQSSSGQLLCFHRSTKHDCAEKKTQPSAQSSTSLWRNTNQKWMHAENVWGWRHYCQIFNPSHQRPSHLKSLVQIFKNSWHLCNASHELPKGVSDAIWESWHGIFLIILNIAYNKLVTKWCDFQIVTRAQGAAKALQSLHLQGHQTFTQAKASRESRRIFCFVAYCKVQAEQIHVNSLTPVFQSQTPSGTLFIFHKTFVFSLGVPWSIPFLGWKLSLQCWILYHFPNMELILF